MGAAAWRCGPQRRWRHNGGDTTAKATEAAEEAAGAAAAAPWAPTRALKAAAARSMAPACVKAGGGAGLQG